MTHRDRAGDPSGQRAGRREAAGEPAAGESVGASESLDDPSSAAAALPLRRVDAPSPAALLLPGSSPARSLWVITKDLWQYDHRRLAPARPSAGTDDPEQAVVRLEPRPSSFPLRNCHMPAGGEVSPVSRRAAEEGLAQAWRREP